MKPKKGYYYTTVFIQFTLKTLYQVELSKKKKTHNDNISYKVV